MQTFTTEWGEDSAQARAEDRAYSRYVRMVSREQRRSSSKHLMLAMVIPGALAGFGSLAVIAATGQTWLASLSIPAAIAGIFAGGALYLHRSK